MDNSAMFQSLIDTVDATVGSDNSMYAPSGMMLAARSAVLPPDWPRRRREAPTVESRPEGGKDENGNRSIFDDVDE